MREPRFITLEGIEGCGKTVQSRLLSRELLRREIPHLLTREPGGTRFGEALRGILLSDDDIEREPVAEMLLYLADRCQHLAEVIRPALERGEWVISDRYHDATLAYQGYARGFGIQTIDSLSRDLNILIPDQTLVIDVPVETALRRARSRNHEERRGHLGRFEAEDADFHRRVREGYSFLREREPSRFLFVDGGGSEREVFTRMLEALERAGVL